MDMRNNMAKTNEVKIIVQVNDELVELSGAEKETFIADRQQTQDDHDAQITAKAAAKAAAQAKLAALGLTTDDLRALGL
jgi:hypothetical protein